MLTVDSPTVPHEPKDFVMDSERRVFVKKECPGWDSNPHRTEFETAASAVGLPGQ